MVWCMVNVQRFHNHENLCNTFGDNLHTEKQMNTQTNKQTNKQTKVNEYPSRGTDDVTNLSPDILIH